ncbi:FliH/SctL family protein [Blastococcus goldschmidtiae]|uniref:FliH/SctL family protein n=1 Tax=Blastococcus goldschmidtiae TaxID=3075546 RepID=A0ABU2K621_9ACTN|nr:FliH/SctL family protein [Blastococcus sp. DSM 46792]MDT0275646.1 FliH/SctL family protein [Blastococcus sp. DSM 46792]
MSSLPDIRRSNATPTAPPAAMAVVLRGADAGGPPAPRAPREGAVLRGGAASTARPYRPLADASAPPAVPPQASPVERRTTVRRAEDQPVAGGRPTFRLGEVYAEELDRLRRQAHAEGFAAGHAEGMTAAAGVVAEAERAATERLAETQQRWERRIASAAASLGAAAARLEEAALPTADEIRETVLGSVLTLVEDLLGRELALAESPVLDALHRALTLCPSDAPALVRVHPDDLAEIPADALAGLPDSVRLVGDTTVERAGAIAETGSRRIDAQLVTALERVQAVLSS